MLRKGYIVLIALVVFVLTVVPAYAGLVFVGGGGFGFGSLLAHVTVAGFGNDTDTVTVSVNVTGSGVTVWCQSKGGNLAPGQNSVTIDVSSAQTITAQKNGRSDINFDVDLVAGISPTAAGCANKNWSVVDLTGLLRVHFIAVNNTTQERAELKYDCDYNAPLSYVSCTPATTW